MTDQYQELIKLLRLNQHWHNAAQTYVVGLITFDSTHWPTLFLSSAWEQLIINDLCELHFRQLLITPSANFLDVFLCSKPKKIISVNTRNQVKHLSSSDHSLFFVKSSTDFQPKNELKPPLAKTRLRIICIEKSKLERIRPIHNWSSFYPFPKKQRRSIDRPLVRMAFGDPASFSSHQN